MYKYDLMDGLGKLEEDYILSQVYGYIKQMKAISVYVRNKLLCTDNKNGEI